MKYTNRYLLIIVLGLIPISLHLLNYRSKVQEQHSDKNNSERKIQVISATTEDWRTKRRQCSPSQSADTDSDHTNANLKFWTDMPSREISKHRSDWKNFMKTIPKRIASNQDGIIFTSYSGVFKLTLLAIKLLRSQGCTLPIEVWHFGTELNTNEIMTFDAMEQVFVRNLVDYMDGRFDFKKGDGKMFEVKGSAIMYSKFDRILYMDSDNMAVRDPTFLFSTPAFRNAKNIFWKDFSKTHPKNPIWKILDIECDGDFEQESGQIMIDKTDPKTWEALNLAVYMQYNKNLYFKLLAGDKDTFKYAWQALDAPYHMVLPYAGIVGRVNQNRMCGHTVAQHSPMPVPDHLVKNDDSQEILFLHVNLLKYQSFASLGRGNTFVHLQEYKNPNSPNAHGLVYKQNFDSLCTELLPLSENGQSTSPATIQFNSIFPDFDETYHRIRDTVRG